MLWFRLEKTPSLLLEPFPAIPPLYQEPNLLKPVRQLLTRTSKDKDASLAWKPRGASFPSECKMKEAEYLKQQAAECRSAARSALAGDRRVFLMLARHYEAEAGKTEGGGHRFTSRSY